MTKAVHEIITYLKNNHDVGMGYGFMPPDVRAWCEAQPDKGILQVYDAEKKDWKPVRNAADFKFNDARIYSIPDTYTMYPEFPGEWVDLEIDNKGEFAIPKNLVGGAEPLQPGALNFRWYEIDRAREAFRHYGINLSEFGGWKYPGSDRYYMAPAIVEAGEDGKHRCAMSYTNNKNIKPIIPERIRFWKTV